MATRFHIGHPIVRSAAAVSVALLVAVFFTTTPGGRPTDVGVMEPYPPFRMTYILDGPDSQGGTVTTELVWNDRRSWTTTIVDATAHRDRLVGQSTAYDGKTVTIRSPMTGTTVLTPGHIDGATTIPAEWLIP